MTGLQRDLIYFPLGHIEYFEYSFNMPSGLMVEGLYPLFVKTKSEYEWPWSAAQTFDEIFFQLTRIYLDPHPEEDWHEKYIQDTTDNLELEAMYRAYYVFSFVLSILKLQRTVPSKIKYFMVALEDTIANWGYESDFSQWVYLNQHWQCDMDFSPRPNVNLNQYCTEAWREVTDDFEKWKIDSIIRKYKRKEYKLNVLNAIEHAHLGTEFESDLPF